MTSHRGYSVFEVLVAFAIMAMVLSALLPGQTRWLVRASDADDVLLAEDVGRSRLALLRAGPLPPIGSTRTTDGPFTSHETVEPAIEAEGGATLVLTVRIETMDGRLLATLRDIRNVP